MKSPPICRSNRALKTRHNCKTLRKIRTFRIFWRPESPSFVSLAGGFMLAHRAPIIAAAARNNVPAVYGVSYFARDGGLLSYGPDPTDLYRHAASYVDRILRGAKPGDLPVQFPTKFEMVVNLSLIHI